MYRKEEVWWCHGYFVNIIKPYQWKIQIGKQQYKINMKTSKTIILLVLAIFGMKLLTACQDEDLQPQPEPQPLNKLEAKAGADLQITTGTLVSLDGSASKDGNGKPFNFSWTFKSKPSASTADLNNASTATPSFTPDVAGTYLVELKISSALCTAIDMVSITATAPGEEPGPTAVIISEDINEDRVLEDIFTDGTLADYIVTANITVSARLTVNPGVKIHFEQDKGLKISPEGTLIAKGINDGTGSTEKGITFTGKDDSKGFWKGILLMSNNPLNELEYVSIENGGSSPFAEMPSQTTANLVLLSTNTTTAALKVSKSIFYNSAGYGMFLHSNSELREFENNYFQNNTGSAIYVPAHQLHKLDFYSHFTGNNGFDGVETGGSVNQTEEVVWPDFNDGSRYFVTNDINLHSGVSIQPGATFEFKEGLVLRVMDGAYLNAIGTAASKIIFTAHTKNPAYYWGSILFNSASEQNKLQFAEVSYAGSNPIPNYGGNRANIIITTSGKAQIQNSSIKHGLGWGLIGYTDKGAQINANVNEANSYEDLSSGNTKLTSGEVSLEQLEGDWLEYESFENNLVIDEKFYDRTTSTWFRGAESPWDMNPNTGFGLKIDGTGNYSWITAERHEPGNGCGAPYNAEYITGNISVNGTQIQFQESYWRSKFFNPCDGTQNGDISVTPGSMVLNFTIERYYHFSTGEYMFSGLKLFLLDGSNLTYYKR